MEVLENAFVNSATVEERAVDCELQRQSLLFSDQVRGVAAKSLAKRPTEAELWECRWNARQTAMWSHGGPNVVAECGECHKHLTNFASLLYFPPCP